MNKPSDDKNVIKEAQTVKVVEGYVQSKIQQEKNMSDSMQLFLYFKAIYPDYKIMFPLIMRMLFPLPQELIFYTINYAIECTEKLENHQFVSTLNLQKITYFNLQLRQKIIAKYGGNTNNSTHLEQIEPVNLPSQQYHELTNIDQSEQPTQVTFNTNEKRSSVFYQPVLNDQSFNFKSSPLIFKNNKGYPRKSLFLNLANIEESFAPMEKSYDMREKLQMSKHEICYSIEKERSSPVVQNSESHLTDPSYIKDVLHRMDTTQFKMLTYQELWHFMIDLEQYVLNSKEYHQASDQFIHQMLNGASSSPQQYVFTEDESISKMDQLVKLLQTKASILLIFMKHMLSSSLYSTIRQKYIKQVDNYEMRINEAKSSATKKDLQYSQNNSRLIFSPVNSYGRKTLHNLEVPVLARDLQRGNKDLKSKQTSKQAKGRGLGNRLTEFRIKVDRLDSVRELEENSEEEELKESNDSYGQSQMKSRKNSKANKQQHLTYQKNIDYYNGSQQQKSSSSSESSSSSFNQSSKLSFGADQKHKDTFDYEASPTTTQRELYLQKKSKVMSQDQPKISESSKKVESPINEFKQRALKSVIYDKLISQYQKKSTSVFQSEYPFSSQPSEILDSLPDHHNETEIKNMQNELKFSATYTVPLPKSPQRSPNTILKPSLVQMYGPDSHFEAASVHKQPENKHSPQYKRQSRLALETISDIRVGKNEEDSLPLKNRDTINVVQQQQQQDTPPNHDNNVVIDPAILKLQNLTHRSQKDLEQELVPKSQETTNLSPKQSFAYRLPVIGAANILDTHNAQPQLIKDDINPTWSPKDLLKLSKEIQPIIINIPEQEKVRKSELQANNKRPKISVSSTNNFQKNKSNEFNEQQGEKLIFPVKQILLPIVSAHSHSNSNLNDAVNESTKINNICNEIVGINSDVKQIQHSKTNSPKGLDKDNFCDHIQLNIGNETFTKENVDDDNDNLTSEIKLSLSHQQKIQAKESHIKAEEQMILDLDSSQKKSMINSSDINQSNEQILRQNDSQNVKHSQFIENSIENASHKSLAQPIEKILSKTLDPIFIQDVPKQSDDKLATFQSVINGTDKEPQKRGLSIDLEAPVHFKNINSCDTSQLNIQPLQDKSNTHLQLLNNREQLIQEQPVDQDQNNTKNIGSQPILQEFNLDNKEVLIPDVFIQKQQRNEPKSNSREFKPDQLAPQTLLLRAPLDIPQNQNDYNRVDLTSNKKQNNGTMISNLLEVNDQANSPQLNIIPLQIDGETEKHNNQVSPRNDPKVSDISLNNLSKAQVPIYQDIQNANNLFNDGNHQQISLETIKLQEQQKVLQLQLDNMKQEQEDLNKQQQQLKLLQSNHNQIANSGSNITCQNDDSQRLPNNSEQMSNKSINPLNIHSVLDLGNIPLNENSSLAKHINPSSQHQFLPKGGPLNNDIKYDSQNNQKQSLNSLKVQEQLQALQKQQEQILKRQQELVQQQENLMLQQQQLTSNAANPIQHVSQNTPFNTSVNQNQIKTLNQLNSLKSFGGSLEQPMLHTFVNENKVPLNTSINPSVTQDNIQNQTQNDNFNKQLYKNIETQQQPNFNNQKEFPVNGIIMNQDHPKETSKAPQNYERSIPEDMITMNKQNSLDKFEGKIQDVLNKPILTADQVQSHFGLPKNQQIDHLQDKLKNIPPCQEAHDPFSQQQNQNLYPNQYVQNQEQNIQQHSQYLGQNYSDSIQNHSKADHLNDNNIENFSYPAQIRQEELQKQQQKIAQVKNSINSKLAQPQQQTYEHVPHPLSDHIQSTQSYNQTSVGQLQPLKLKNQKKKFRKGEAKFENEQNQKEQNFQQQNNSIPLQGNLTPQSQNQQLSQSNQESYQSQSSDYSQSRSGDLDNSIIKSQENGRLKGNGVINNDSASSISHNKSNDQVKKQRQNRSQKRANKSKKRNDNNQKSRNVDNIINNDQFSFQDESQINQTKPTKTSDIKQDQSNRFQLQSSIDENENANQGIDQQHNQLKEVQSNKNMPGQNSSTKTKRVRQNSKSKAKKVGQNLNQLSENNQNDMSISILSSAENDNEYQEHDPITNNKQKLRTKKTDKNQHNEKSLINEKDVKEILRDHLQQSNEDEQFDIKQNQNGPNQQPLTQNKRSKDKDRRALINNIPPIIQQGTEKRINNNQNDIKQVKKANKEPLVAESQSEYESDETFENINDDNEDSIGSNDLQRSKPNSLDNIESDSDASIQKNPDQLPNIMPISQVPVQKDNIIATKKVKKVNKKARSKQKNATKKQKNENSKSNTINSAMAIYAKQQVVTSQNTSRKNSISQERIRSRQGSSARDEKSQIISPVEQSTRDLGQKMAMKTQRTLEDQYQYEIPELPIKETRPQSKAKPKKKKYITQASQISTISKPQTNKQKQKQKQNATNSLQQDQDHQNDYIEESKKAQDQHKDEIQTVLDEEIKQNNSKNNIKGKQTNMKDDSRRNESKNQTSNPNSNQVQASSKQNKAPTKKKYSDWEDPLDFGGAYNFDTPNDCIRDVRPPMMRVTSPDPSTKKSQSDQEDDVELQSPLSQRGFRVTQNVPFGKKLKNLQMKMSIIQRNSYQEFDKLKHDSNTVLPKQISQNLSSMSLDLRQYAPYSAFEQIDITNIKQNSIIMKHKSSKQINKEDNLSRHQLDKPNQKAESARKRYSTDERMATLTLSNEDMFLSSDSEDHIPKEQPSKDIALPSAQKDFFARIIQQNAKKIPKSNKQQNVQPVQTTQPVKQLQVKKIGDPSEVTKVSKFSYIDEDDRYNFCHDLGGN